MISEGNDRPAIQRHRRATLERKVTLRFNAFRGFLTEYSANLSAGGMFIRTADSRPPGSAFEFELTLGEDYPLIQGLGEVVWVRPPGAAGGHPSGMGIRFLNLSAKSRELIDRIVTEHLAQGGVPFDVEKIPTSAPVVTPEPPPPSQPSPPPKESPPTTTPSAATPPLHTPTPAPRSLAELPPARRPPPPTRSAVWGPPGGVAVPRRRRLWIPVASFGLSALVALAVYSFIFLDPAFRTPPPVGAPRRSRSAERLPEPTPQKAPATTARIPEPTSTLPTGPVSQLEGITWYQEKEGLVVVLEGNGTFIPESYSRTRLDESPRELVRLHDIRRAYPRSVIPVDSKEVLRIRIGYHRKPDGNQLHVVLDLQSPRVRLRDIETAGDRLLLHLAWSP